MLSRAAYIATYHLSRIARNKPFTVRLCFLGAIAAQGKGNDPNQCPSGIGWLEDYSAWNPNQAPAMSPRPARFQLLLLRSVQYELSFGKEMTIPILSTKKHHQSLRGDALGEESGP